LLPFWALYRFSDIAGFLLHRIFRYRKKIILYNLSIAFPDKTEKERNKIAKNFYYRFTDNFIESIKLLSLSKKEITKRFRCDETIVNTLLSEGKNVQMLLGHFFNWEFANLAYSIAIPNSLVIVYMHIENKLFLRLFNKIRSRFGSHLVNATRFVKEYRPYTRILHAMVLVGDQNPGAPEKSYWTKYFGKTVPFVAGPEKSARLTNSAVIVGRVFRVKRGYYQSEIKLITKEARSLQEGEITKQMVAFLENAIQQQPANYLWSHRRWKWEFDEEKYGNLVV
jgi:KDO2-lipid IV(A) lauroyltransferase